MRIDSGSFNLNLHYEATRQTAVFASQTQAGSSGLLAAPKASPTAPQPALGSDNSAASAGTGTTRLFADANSPLSDFDKLTNNVLKSILSRVFGGDFKLSLPNDPGSTPLLAGNSLSSPTGTGAEGVSPTPATFGDLPNPVQATDTGSPVSDATSGQVPQLFAYDYQSLQYSRESFDLSAEGTIETEDGQSLAFSVSISLSREAYSATRLSAAASSSDSASTSGGASNGNNALDGLQVGFAGAASQVSSTRFEFHLDFQSQTNQAPSTASTRQPSAGLADFEKSDARPSTDFSGLRIFSRDHHGRDKLVAVGRPDNGAVFVGHLPDPSDRRSDRSGPGRRDAGFGNLIDAQRAFEKFFDKLDLFA